MDAQILNRKSERIKRGERTLKKTTSTNDKIEFIKLDYKSKLKSKRALYCSFGIHSHGYIYIRSIAPEITPEQL